MPASAREARPAPELLIIPVPANHDYIALRCDPSTGNLIFDIFMSNGWAQHRLDGRDFRYTLDRHRARHCTDCQYAIENPEYHEWYRNALDAYREEEGLDEDEYVDEEYIDFSDAPPRYSGCPLAQSQWDAYQTSDYRQGNQCRRGVDTTALEIIQRGNTPFRSLPTWFDVSYPFHEVAKQLSDGNWHLNSRARRTVEVGGQPQFITTSIEEARLNVNARIAAAFESPDGSLRTTDRYRALNTYGQDSGQICWGHRATGFQSPAEAIVAFGATPSNDDLTRYASYFPMLRDFRRGEHRARLAIARSSASERDRVIRQRYTHALPSRSRIVSRGGVEAIAVAGGSVFPQAGLLMGASGCVEIDGAPESGYSPFKVVPLKQATVPPFTRSGLTTYLSPADRVGRHWLFASSPDRYIRSKGVMLGQVDDATLAQVQLTNPIS